MAPALFRRFIVALSLLAFVATGLAPAMAMAEAPTSMKAIMSTASDDPMPCCPEKAPSCITDVGCVFLVAVPTPHLTALGPIGWSLLRYELSHDRGEGLSIQPALGPPILSA
jgi:hypothetical protein